MFLIDEELWFDVVFWGKSGFWLYEARSFGFVLFLLKVF